MKLGKTHLVLGRNRVSTFLKEPDEILGMRRRENIEKKMLFWLSLDRLGFIRLGYVRLG